MIAAVCLLMLVALMRFALLHFYLAGYVDLLLGKAYLRGTNIRYR